MVPLRAIDLAHLQRQDVWISVIDLIQNASTGRPDICSCQLLSGPTIRFQTSFGVKTERVPRKRSWAKRRQKKEALVC
jgi:hypothetical protein